MMEGLSVGVTSSQRVALGIDPLKIDHVLENVLSHVIWRNGGFYGRNLDLENVRLVCRQWNVTASTLFRRRRRPLKLSVAGEDSIRKFLSRTNQRSPLPVENYEIHGDLLGDNNEWILRNLISICGLFITKLSLTITTPLYIGTDVSNVGLASGSLPLLKELKYEIYDTSGKHYPAALQMLSLVLQGVSGNLESLHLLVRFYKNEFGWFPEFTRRNSTQEVNQLGSLLSTYLPKSLKILRLILWNNTKRFSVLPLDGDFRLTRFDFVFFSHFDEVELRNFLTKHSETLKFLSVHNMDGTDIPKLPLPDLPRLEELSLLNLEETGISAKSFPQLRKVEGEYWRTEGTFKRFLEIGDRNQERIVLPDFANMDLIRKIGDRLLNLKSVELRVSLVNLPTVLEGVCGYLPGIEELTILHPLSLSANLDSALTGLSQEDVERIRNNGVTSFDDVDITELNQRASLVNLKKLWLLDIRHALITNFTAHFVFLKMDSLKELRCGGINVSVDYRVKLESKLELRVGANE